MTADKKRPVPPHQQPARAARDLQEKAVLAVSETLFKRFVDGEALLTVASDLVPEIPSWRVRSIITSCPQLVERYDAALTERAHNLVEQAVAYGSTAAQIGDSAGLKVAIDVNMKVASKLAPNHYGEKTKMELTGKDGGPVKLLAMTDEQLLEIAAKASKEQSE
jgi:hypothetical protein